jgi:hypothetical protein
MERQIKSVSKIKSGNINRIAAQDSGLGEVSGATDQDQQTREEEGQGTKRNDGQTLSMETTRKLLRDTQYGKKATSQTKP